MALAYSLIVFTTVLFLGCSADETYNVTQSNTTQISKPLGDTKWTFNFAPDLRGLFVFNEYFKLEHDELLSVYWGTDTTQGKYFAVNFTSDYGVGPAPQWQWLSPQMGEAITVVYRKNATGSATSPSTTTSTTTTTTVAPNVPATTPAPFTGPTTPHLEFMFLVTVYNETSSMLPDPSLGGIFNYTVTRLETYQIESNANVTKFYHFYPANNLIKLGFALINATTLPNSNISLILYRGDSNDVTEINSNNTFIKKFYNNNDIDNYMYKLNFGEPLSLYFDYNKTSLPDEKLGYVVVVSPVVDNSNEIPPPYTGSPPTGSTVSINPSNPSAGTTIPVSQTTTSATPFIFSIAPIIVTLIFQLCQNF